MRKLSHKGFSAVEGLLILIIVLLLGFIGYYVYHTNQTASDTLNSSHSTPKFGSAIKTFADCKKAVGSKLLETYPEQCVTKDGKSFTDPNQLTKKYLTIKEWGVKLPLTSTILDATYTLTSNEKDTGSADLSTANTCSAGALFRFKDGAIDSLSGESYAQEFSGSVAVEGYNYIVISSQAQCSSDKAIQQAALANEAAFVAASKSIQAQ